MARETKKKLRNDIRILARELILQNDCIETLVRALPDSKKEAVARIDGMQTGRREGNVWLLAEDG